MDLSISLEEINPDIKNLILDGKLEGGFSIDYALNSLVSYLDGKEIVIFEFKNYFALDNRRKGYEIIKETEPWIITIRFK